MLLPFAEGEGEWCGWELVTTEDVSNVLFSCVFFVVKHAPPQLQPDRSAPVLDLSTPEGRKAELTMVVGYMLRWFIVRRQSRIQVVITTWLGQIQNWKYAAVFINNLHWAFSSVCIIQYFPVFTAVCQCFDSDSDSDSDCELDNLLCVVADWQLIVSWGPGIFLDLKLWSVVVA